ncbi:MAG TPA: HEAT repeat domain-containing protein [Acidobacteriaceae bacterium]|nr:HEAT repeat domain-containing protein [Acidobacteriaceae bacterium]
MNARRSTVCFALLAGLTFGPVHAQDTTPTPPPQQQPAPVQQAQPQEVAPPPRDQRQPEEKGQNFEPNEIRAWSILTDAAGPGRPAHDRVQAMAALGTMGNDERAARLIEEGFTAKDYDVRVAAVLAAGLTKNPKLLPPLERVLDDDNSLVAYTAAITLWKMHDEAGQDLLTAVALGDHKAAPGLIKSEKHKAAKDLHSPKTMAMIAVNQGSGYFLGPFGVGLKAIEMVNKDSGAAPRAAAIDQLAKQHTDQVHEVLVQDLTDGEPAVRAAAAKGLGRWTGDDTAKLVQPMFGDNKLAVRLTAAATYLRAIHNIPTPSDSECEF